MLSIANLSYGFWGEALQTAVYLCNRNPHTSLKGDIPIEVWSGKPATYDHLHIFGCDAYVHVRPELRCKQNVKFIKGLFMGYCDSDRLDYRIWFPQLKKVLRSQDVVFDEARLLQNKCASFLDHKKVKF